MTTGVIDTPLHYKLWNGTNGSKGNRKTPNAYYMTTARVSIASSGLAKDWIVDDVIAYSDMEKDERLCRNDCILKVREAFEQMDLLPFMAELRGTAESMSRRLRQGLVILSSIKRRDWKRIKRLTNRARPADIPSAWLEWNFAMKPFFSDMRTFSSIMDNRFPGFPFKTFSKREGSLTYGDPVNFARWNVTHIMNGEFYPINPNMHLVNQLGLTDLLGAAWELTPWSWAVDYFTNVGDYIANLSPRFNSIVFRDFFETKTRRLSRDLATGWSNGHWAYTSASGTCMRRTLLSSLPNVTLEVDSTLNLRRLSYLLSATALTLMGAGERRRT